MMELIMLEMEMTLIEEDELVEDILVALERAGYVRKVMDGHDGFIWVVTADLLHVARRSVAG
jgi:hypothetical protein